MGFFERYKKFLFAAGFLLVTIFFGYMIYRTFFKSPAPQISELPPEATTTSAGLPQAGEGGARQIVGSEQPTNLTGNGRQSPDDDGNAADKIDETANGGITRTHKITDTPGVNIKVSGDKVQYWNPDDGKFYKIDGNGNKVALSDKAFYKVQDVTWSPVNDKAIIEFPDKTKIIYDFQSNKQVTLPSHWQDFSFSSAGDSIAAKSIGNDPDNRWLITMDDNGSTVKPIEKIANPAVVIPSYSPNNQIVAMYTESGGLNSQEVYFVGLHGENFKSTQIEGRDFRPQWSPKGDRLVYSVYSDATNLKPTLWVVDAQGDQIGNNRQALDIQTWADKCAFADDTTLYCAVPRTLEKGAGMFPQLAENTADTIYRINTVTGVKERVAIPEGDHTITEIGITDDGQKVYFNDRNTGNIYKIDLK